MTLCRMKYYYGVAVVVVLIWISSGCAPHQTKIEEEKEIGVHQILSGIWEDTQSHSTVIIEEKGGTPTVVSVYGAGGEDFEVKSKWDGTKLSWTYRVPSTGIVVEFATQIVQGNILRCTYFSPIGGAGVSELRRIK